VTLRTLLARTGTTALATAALLLCVMPADASAIGKHDPVNGAVRLDVPYDATTPHVIDVGGTGDRAKAQLWALTSGRHQNVRAVRWGTRNGNPVVFFQDTNSQGCLDESQDRPPANGTVVYFYTCRYSANQLWELREGSLGYGWSAVSLYDGRCLDARDKSYANGTQLQVWSCSGAWNQLWLTNVY
jgi:hypothetical protein